MRGFLFSLSAAALLLTATMQPASATAIAMGPGQQSPAALLAGVNIRTSNTLDGLAYTMSVLEHSAFKYAEGNAQAFGQASAVGGQGTLSGTHDHIFSSVSIGVRAQAAGHAIADMRRIVAVELVNTTDHVLVFDVFAAYGIGTAVTVSDILTESVLAYWNVGVEIDADRLFRFGEFGRTIDCSYPLQNSNACPNLYDSNDGPGVRIELEAGESLDMTFVTIGRYEATAISEPSTLLLLSAAGLGLFALRRRARA